MARGYSAEYERREELAEERGFDSFYEERSARDDAREWFSDHGYDDPTSAEVLEFAQFENGFVEGDWSRDDLMEYFYDHYDWADEDDFWDWLGELYGEG
jgi:hypothetical protein